MAVFLGWETEEYRSVAGSKKCGMGMDTHGAQTYNQGLWAEPQRGPGARAPGQGSGATESETENCQLLDAQRKQ